MSTRPRANPWFREPGARYELAVAAYERGGEPDAIRAAIPTPSLPVIERAILERLGAPTRMLADMLGGAYPKRRYRYLEGERRLVVIPKRIRLGIEQRPHPGGSRG